MQRFDLGVLAAFRRSRRKWAASAGSRSSRTRNMLPLPRLSDMARIFSTASPLLRFSKLDERIETENLAVTRRSGHCEHRGVLFALLQKCVEDTTTG